VADKTASFLDAQARRQVASFATIGPFILQITTAMVEGQVNPQLWPRSQTKAAIGF
jgi:hypothetical protein